MTQRIYRTRWGSDTVALMADWDRDDSPIYRQTDDDWDATGWQVATYGGPRQAMRVELTALARADGLPDPEAAPLIARALDVMAAE